MIPYEDMAKANALFADEFTAKFGDLIKKAGLY